MKSNYNEKQERRKERYEQLSEKAKQEAQNAWKQSDNLASVIPPGQPILIGHHSEIRHRRHLEKIHNKMGQSVQLSKKAEYYEQKAKAIENNRAISSDDPEAVQKLEEKIRRAKDIQAFMKGANKILKSKKLTDAQKMQKLVDEWDMKEENAKLAIEPNGRGAVGFPSYSLTNNNANIKRLERRLKELKIAEEKESAFIFDDGFLKVFENLEENRLQLIFSGKPEENIRKLAKSCGFKWAPSQSAWQRKITANAKFSLNYFLKRYQE